MPTPSAPTPARTEALPPRERDRRILFVAAGLGTAGVLAAAGVAWALFTSEASVTGHSVGTATIEIEAGVSAGSAPIEVEDMLPGDVDSMQLVLENTGSGDVYLDAAVAETESTDVALAAALQITMVVGDDSHSATLAEWQAGRFQLGSSLAPDGSAAVTVSVELPEGADNELQGLDAGFSVDFSAVQTRGVATPETGWVAD